MSALLQLGSLPSLSVSSSGGRGRTGTSQLPQYDVGGSFDLPANTGTPPRPPQGREFFIDNLLVRIHFIIVMIRWTGLAPWDFESTFPGSLASTLLAPSRAQRSKKLYPSSSPLTPLRATRFAAWR